jgi:hypothetical protein
MVEDLNATDKLGMNNKLNKRSLGALLDPCMAASFPRAFDI